MIETVVDGFSWSNWYNKLSTTDKQRVQQTIASMGGDIKNISLWDDDNWNTFYNGLTTTKKQDFINAIEKFDTTIKIVVAYINPDGTPYTGPPAGVPGAGAPPPSTPSAYKIVSAIAFPPNFIFAKSSSGAQKNWTEFGKTFAQTQAIAASLVGKDISWQKGAFISTGPQIGMFGEAGPEAIIPLQGSNRKYGEELLKYIIPKYYPELLKLQQGAVVNSGRSYDYSNYQNENYTIAGPINIVGVENPEDFMNKLKFKMRASR